MADIYRQILTAALPRLLNQINLEPTSELHGSADRLHWAWGAKEFTNADTQRAVQPLALAALLRLKSREETAGLLAALLRRWVTLQHSDGTFDQWFPHEHSLGTTAFTLLEVTAALEIFPEFAEATRAAIRRAAEALAGDDEAHGFISNHRAGMALALLRASRFQGGVASWEDKARRLITGILSGQSSEGWFREYTGADPGYETLGLSYLAECWRLQRDPALLRALERSLGFLQEVMPPDGALGGDYGARGTFLVFPAGFESLAEFSALAARLAGRVRQAFTDGVVPLPGDLDDSNFFALLSNVAAAARHAAGAALPLPPCMPPSETVTKFFPEAGFLIHRAAGRFVLVSTRKLGVCMVHDGAGARHQAGYAGVWNGRFIASAVENAAVNLVRAETELTLEGPLQVAPLAATTPARLFLLKAFFRFCAGLPALRHLAKNRLVGLLIAARRPAPVRLRRVIRLGDRIEMIDTLSNVGTTPVTLAPVDHCVPFYMGSARYLAAGQAAARRDAFTLAPGDRRENRFEF